MSRKTPRDEERAALENRALLAARTLVDRMRALYRELEQLTGAPISHHRALVSIAGEPGLSASRLASLLGMQRPAVSQLLKSMTQHGWVERRRSERDQRAVHVFVTAAGRQVLQATAGRAVFTLQRAVCSMPPDKLQALIASVELLLTQLPAQSPAATPPARRGKSRRRAPAKRESEASAD
jgi:DNA-binding MarR family transcriptional regulator